MKMCTVMLCDNDVCSKTGKIILPITEHKSLCGCQKSVGICVLLWRINISIFLDIHVCVHTQTADNYCFKVCLFISAVQSRSGVKITLL